VVDQLEHSAHLAVKNASMSSLGCVRLVLTTKTVPWKEVAVPQEPSNDTASTYFHGEPIPARVSAVPDLTTTIDGESCITELCTNHSRQDDNFEYTMSLGSNFTFTDYDSLAPVPTETF